MGWSAFWQVLAEGAAFATFGFWGAPLLLAAACWVALTTTDALLRWLLLGLGMLALLNLASIALAPIVSAPALRPLFALMLITPFFAFWGHLYLLFPDGGARMARVAWAAANLTFVTRSIVFAAPMV